MHIAFILPSFPVNSTVDEFWDYGLCQVNQARALVALGHDVTVITRYSESRDVERDGISYCFVEDKHPETLRSWQYSKPVLEKIKAINPNIVHFHGLGFPVFIIKLLLGVTKPTQVLVEYHGGTISRFPMSLLQSLSLNCVKGLVFTNFEKAEEWSAGLGLSRNRFHYSVECAPDRVMGDRTAARQRTGFYGNPVIIWNSRAIRRRNPDIVIESYERYLQSNQNIECHFYMMVPDYDAEVLQKIKAMSIRSSLLKKHFTLIIERKPQPEMTDFYNSADYIISGSEDDPYGYGIVDAMSCGVIPIVTKSRTFLDITNEGEIGLLWDVANPASLVEALNRMTLDKDDIARSSRDVQSVFCNNLSMAAQGKFLEEIYRKALR